MSAPSSMKAGRIAFRVLEETKNFIEVDTSIIDICGFAEDVTSKLGGTPAFPCNVAVNDVAAHYTASLEDTTTIGDGDLVKIDIGVHVDGYIADTATTVCFGPRYDGLIKAAKASLGNTIKLIKEGMTASNIKESTEKTIRLQGFTPIHNLSSHRMVRYILHTNQPTSRVLREGEVYAIEPFSTVLGAIGLVVSGPPSNIYLFKRKKRTLDKTEKEMIKLIQSRYRFLPFASRWVLKDFQGERGVRALGGLLETKCIYSYPQLVEEGGDVVAQAEHTIIVTRDGCVITTDKNQSSGRKAK